MLHQTTKLRNEVVRGKTNITWSSTWPHALSLQCMPVDEGNGKGVKQLTRGLRVDRTFVVEGGGIVPRDGRTALGAGWRKHGVLPTASLVAMATPAAAAAAAASAGAVGRATAMLMEPGSGPLMCIAFRSVSIASMLDCPSRETPFTSSSLSSTRSRPS